MFLSLYRYVAKQDADLDLLRQFQIYEAVLRHEDGDEKGTPLRQLDESIRYATLFLMLLISAIFLLSFIHFEPLSL